MKNDTVVQKLDEDLERKIAGEFHKKTNKILLLDYDGTLVGFKDNPQDAAPDEKLFALLDGLNNREDTKVILISGRDRETFEKWFGGKNYNLVTDHGVWLHENKNWLALEHLKTDWMESIRPILETFVDRTPGTFIETKNYSLAWHYRTADPELAKIRTMELNTVLTSMVANNNLSILKGNKVIEIKSSNVSKGRATSRLLMQDQYDFIAVIGDDWTDEYMFEESPDWAYTIKVGHAKTKAKYQIKDPSKVREFLEKLL
jgi:trehalose 6-phosphate synthase/phosphatase